MDQFIQNNPIVFNYMLLPLAIVCARIFDVSIGTLRIIFVGRGLRYVAPVLGFFEVLIWLIAISQIMSNLTNWINYVAYATGFALGNFVGMAIEERMAMGLIAVRIITQKDATELIAAIGKNDFGVTSVPAQGINGDVHLIFSIVKRKNKEQILKLVWKFNPTAFVSIEDVRSAHEGIFPSSSERNYTDRLFNSSLKRK